MKVNVRYSYASGSGAIRQWWKWFSLSALLSESTAFVDIRNFPRHPIGSHHVLRSSQLRNIGNDGIWYSDSFSNTPKRVPVMAGNWKLNPNTLSDATNLLKLIASNFLHHRSASDPEVVIFPPYPFLMPALELLEGTGIKVGAQNCALQESPGAFTGEVSASMIRSMGCDYVMLGHSERRTLFGETDAKINAKAHLCLKQPGLGIILCIGETLEEYQSNLLESVVEMQLKKGLAGLKAEDISSSSLIIAYEPCWAINTGIAATPQQANTAHMAVRRTLTKLFGADVAQSIRIQYGGSVKPDNIEDLMAMPEIDGALVGGASLTADGFTRIVDGAVSISSSFSAIPRELTARECLPTKNVLGESPVWSERDQCLYWVSAPEEEVWTWNLVDPPYRRLMGTVLGCVALKAGDPGSIVLGGERAILELTMSPTTTDFASGPAVLCDRPDLASMTRPNDGRVDRQGRLVFGMYNNYHRSGASEGSNNAGLYRLDANLQYEKLLDHDFRVSNCICFSSNGETMFFCDTPTRKVYAFDYPKERGGMLTNRRLIWSVPSNLDGAPDGAQVDADGCIWIALSGAGRVVRVKPSTGMIDCVVHLPVKSPTSCTFGGPNLDELFMTTRGPDGGGLYRVKMPHGIRGLPEPEFQVGTNGQIISGSPPSATPTGHSPRKDYTWWNKVS
ncbi:triosephosphate isomerase [Nitzschia inconspicua]|uniref:triose-phosphate isomerase n=1 Tax=Nitzschia inconspicua TaxID=303405 RepID=A0A9K3PX42_9STRA|nr:triosephosphate isomerase [Nitzschia inconspicua]